MARNFFKIDKGLTLTPQSIAPVNPVVGDIYCDATDSNKIKRWNGSAWESIGSGEWGQITGTLSNQTDLQSALNAKQATITGAATTITNSDLTASRAVVSDGSGKITQSATTSTEIGYVAGVTSAIQTQLDSKLSLSGGTMSGNINMGFSYINNLSNPANASDAATQESVRLWTEELLPNGTAELGITGWTEGFYAAATRPAGAFTSNSTINTFNLTQSFTNPLSGNASFILTKNASNQQGRAVVSEFPLQPAYRAKVLTITSDYIVNSGTFTAGNASTDSSLIWYVQFYDGSVWTEAEPSSFKLLSNSTTVADQFSATVQTPYNATQMRLIAYVAENTTQAWSIKCEMSVKPSKYVHGTPNSDWTPWVPTVSSNTGSLTNYTIDYAEWMRDGQNAYYRLKLRFTGAPGTWNQPRFSLPDGQVPTANTPETSLANAVLNDSGTNDYEAKARVLSNQIQITSLQGTNGIGQAVTSTAPFTWASGDSIIALVGPVQIQGWSSSVQMSDGASTRIVAAKALGNPDSATSGNPIIVPSVAFDTHGAYNPVTGRYTVIVPGIYRISFVGIVNPLAAHTITVYKNGASDTLLGAISANTNAVTGSVSVTAVAGDLLDVRPNATVDYSGGTSLMFERLSGPSAIAASEKVYASYNSSSGQSIANGSATIINFNNKEQDSHGAVTTGANWLFKSPRPDFYTISSYVDFVADAGWSGNERVIFEVYKNNSVSKRLDYKHINPSTSGASVKASASGTVSMWLNAGETVDLRVNQNVGNALALEAVASQVWVTIQSQGGV